MDFDFTKVGNYYFQLLQKYVYGRTDYLEGIGHEVDDDDRRQMSDEYKASIYEVISFLTRTYPKVAGPERFTFDFQQMMKALSIETRNFIKLPKLDCTFKPVEKSAAVVSVDDGYVTEAYNMEKIKGLPFRYRTKNFNIVVQGYSIYELRSLLDELRVLPEDNIIDKFINEHEMRLEEREDFLKAVIAKLILNGEEEDLVRAYLFDKYMMIGFDFEQFRLVPEQEKRTK